MKRILVFVKEKIVAATWEREFKRLWEGTTLWKLFKKTNYFKTNIHTPEGVYVPDIIYSCNSFSYNSEE